MPSLRILLILLIAAGGRQFYPDHSDKLSPSNAFYSKSGSPAAPTDSIWMALEEDEEEDDITNVSIHDSFTWINSLSNAFRNHVYLNYIPSGSLIAVQDRALCLRI